MKKAATMAASLWENPEKFLFSLAFPTSLVHPHTRMSARHCEASEVPLIVRKIRDNWQDSRSCYFVKNWSSTKLNIKFSQSWAFVKNCVKSLISTPKDFLSFSFCLWNLRPESIVREHFKQQKCNKLQLKNTDQSRLLSNRDLKSDKHYKSAFQAPELRQLSPFTPLKADTDQISILNHYSKASQVLELRLTPITLSWTEPKILPCNLEEKGHTFLPRTLNQQR